MDKCVYYEKHHIIPKSVGGNDNPDNICILLPREHFVCHWLLTKMVSGKSKYKNSKFYNNGVEQKMFLEGKNPDGWVKGRLNKPWNYDIRKEK